MLRSLLFLLMVAPMSFAFQGTKVGIVDADTVIQESNRGKAFLNELDIFSQARRQDLQTMADKRDSLMKDLQAKAASMSKANLESSRKEINQLEVDIKRKQEDATREAEIKLKTGLDEIRNEMVPLIRQVAIEKDLDMVLNMGPQSQVVYFHERIDITKDVIKKYDEMIK